MGNLPVVHETVTSIQCLGDVVTGNVERPKDRWRRYAEESVIGSGIYAAHMARTGDLNRAQELGKGMGRATGKALLLGGILRDVPLFHELATCGESLGDMIGGGDRESAEKRWDNYANQSVIGSGIYAAHEARMGNIEHARELGIGMAKATGKGVIAAGAFGLTVVSGGLTAPLGVAGAAAIGGLVGAATGAGASASTQAIDGKGIDAGDVVGGGIIGGVSGAVGGAIAAKVTRAAARTTSKAGEATETITKTIASSEEAVVTSDVAIPAIAAPAAISPAVVAGTALALGAAATATRRDHNLHGQSIFCQMFQWLMLLWRGAEKLLLIFQFFWMKVRFLYMIRLLEVLNLIVEPFMMLTMPMAFRRSLLVLIFSIICILQISILWVGCILLFGVVVARCVPSVIPSEKRK